MKRYIALIVAIISTFSYIPAFAEGESEDMLPAQSEYITEHETFVEEIPYDVPVIEEEGEPPVFAQIYMQENSPSTYSTTEELWTEADIWKKMYAQAYGESYISPLLQNNGGVNVSGKTNSLTVENADLHFPGKNGLDLIIKRMYDNQSDGYAYSSYATEYERINNRLHLYNMRNKADNSIITVGTYTKDEYYLYLDGEIRLSQLPSDRTIKSATGKVYTYYPVEYLAQKISEDGDIVLEGIEDSHISIAVISDFGVIKLESIKTSTDFANLGCGFSIQLPEFSMWKCSWENDTSEYPKYYYDYYQSSFRGFDGNIYTAEPETTLKKTSAGVTTFSFTCSSNENSYLTYHQFYEAQTLADINREYNFTVTDSKGLTYYFFNADFDKINQRMMPVAVCDEFGNKIIYSFDSNRRLIKITDTYEREINISYGENEVTLSYFEGDELKTIEYKTEELSKDAVTYESCLKGKPVQRFTYTNENGEQTQYFLREGSLPIVLDFPGNFLSEYHLADIEECHVVNMNTHNLEKIVYPNGKESFFKYKPIYLEDSALWVRRGYYTATESYDISDGNIKNKKTYDMYENTWTSDDDLYVSSVDENGHSFVELYGKNDRMNESQESYNGVLVKKYYTYANRRHISQIKETKSGETVTVNYSYYKGYPFALKSTDNGKTKIEYTYHTVDGKMKGIPQTVTYQSMSDDKYVTDYTVTGVLTSDNRKISYEETTVDEAVVSRKDYTYNSWGDIASESIKLNGEETHTVNTSYEINDDKTLDVSYLTSGVTDADGESLGTYTKSVTVDIHGRPVSGTDSNGNTTLLEYDNTGRLTKQIYPNGGEREISYNLAERKVTVTEISGVEYIYTYDEQDCLLSLERVNGNETELLEENSYDAYNRLTEKKEYISEGKGKKTEYTYDNANRVLTEKISKIEGNEWCYTLNYSYPTYYQTVKTVSSADNSTHAKETTYYDKFERKIQVIRRSGSDFFNNLYKYDGYDNLITFTDGKGYKEHYSYDFRGNLLETVRADGASSSNTYDMAGRKISSTDFMGNTSYYTYDKLSRLVYREIPFDEAVDSEEKYYYDKNGNMLKKKILKDSGIWLQEEYEYDTMNNMTGAVYGEGAEASAVKYSYDLSGNLITQTTGLSNLSAPLSGGKTTQYVYDSFGNLIRETDPMGYYALYDYDLAGNMVFVQDKNGQPKNYEYDLFGLKTIITLDGIVMTERDSLGREIEKTGLNTDVTEEITYDAFGRVSEREIGNIIQSYTYDKNSNITEYTLKEGSLPLKTESYTYDNLNRITGITDNGTLTAYSYNLNGRLTQKAVTGGITASYAYNDGGYLTNITYPGKSFSASYYLNGMKSSENINGVIKNYSYDSQGRLTGVTGAEGSLEAYTYDINGNRISKAENGASYSYSYDDNNRLTEETKNPEQLNEEARSFTYDNNGNLIKETASGDSGLLLPLPGENEKNYEYNSLGQLVSFTDGEADAEYEYFYDGLRVNKSVNNSETEYIWNGSNLAYETNPSGSYIYGYDMTGIVSADISGIKNYYIKDIHGNISATVSAGGVESESMTYSSFGEMSGNDFPLTPFGYCGEYLDSESGLIYLRNRYYDSNIGRFITEDPVKDGLNWYVYCSNNPVNLIDPSGYEEKQDKYILNKDDYNMILVLTQEYLVQQSYGNVAEMEAIHKAAVRIRQKTEYSDKYNKGQYIDEYKYKYKTSYVSVNVNIMSEGFAWLVGGENKKNDIIMDIIGVIPNGGVDKVLGPMETMVSLSDYNRTLSVLRKGDICFQLNSTTISRQAYYKNDLFIAAREDHYSTGITKYYMNASIKKQSMIDALKPWYIPLK